MTPLLTEFAGLRPHGVYDGELVAFGDDGRPDFTLVCERLLQRHSNVPLALMVFDVLALRGRDLTAKPYRMRREILEGIEFNGRAHVPDVFDDGQALFDAVCEWEMEGVVAKRLQEHYRPGERSWVKTKNREYWRYEMEREGVTRVVAEAREDSEITVGRCNAQSHCRASARRPPRCRFCLPR